MLGCKLIHPEAVLSSVLARGWLLRRGSLLPFRPEAEEKQVLIHYRGITVTMPTTYTKTDRGPPGVPGVENVRVTYAECPKAVGPPRAVVAVSITKRIAWGLDKSSPRLTQPTHPPHSTKLTLLSTCSFREAKGTPSRSSWLRPRHWTSRRGFWQDRSVISTTLPGHGGTHRALSSRKKWRERDETLPNQRGDGCGSQMGQVQGRSALGSRNGKRKTES